jgi:hypothetical protein
MVYGYYKVVHLIKGHPFCHEEVAYLEDDNFVVLYYLCGFTVWTYDRVGIWLK